jgi:hypothetical protein
LIKAQESGLNKACSFLLWRGRGRGRAILQIKILKKIKKFLKKSTQNA